MRRSEHSNKSHSYAAFLRMALKGCGTVYCLGVLMVSGYKFLENILTGQLYRFISSLTVISTPVVLAGEIGRIFLLLGVIVGITVAGTMLYVYTTVQADKRLRMTLTEKLLHLPLSVWNRMHSGYWMNLLSKDTDTAAESYKDAFVSIVKQLVQAAGGTILLCWHKPSMALFALLSGGIYLGVGLGFKGKAKTFAALQQKKSAEAAAVMSDVLNGYPVIRFFGMQKRFHYQHTALNRESEAAGRKWVKNTALASACSSFGYGIAYVGALIFGLWLVNQGGLSLPDMLFLWPTSLSTSYAVMRIGFNIAELQPAIAAQSRIEDALLLPDEAGGTEIEKRSDVPLCFNKVSFGYTADAPILKNVSLTVQSGEKVAVVGLSGSGKSTLAKLALGFYQPDAGEVSVYGVSTKDWTLRSLREHFSYLAQFPQLFSGSLADNIRIVAPEADDAVLRQAANQADAGFIDNLPDGWTSEAGEGGKNLSGGQRQRIGLTRAYLRNAPIFLFDEMTSALDAATEQRIARQLFQETNRTVVMITHKLFLAELSDRIIVMEDGAVIEEGSHEALLQRNGAYARLWAEQSGK